VGAATGALGLPRSAAALGAAAALGLAGVALVPMALTYAPILPFTMEAVAVPRWYATVAPKLPPGQVLLSYPAPFSGIQVSMAWQAVDAISYSQAGGGGPQGVPDRAGSARSGFTVLTRLAFALNGPQATGTPTELASVRHALTVWRVTTVVVAPQATSANSLHGRDPVYAAAFMTAVLGRVPRISAGAWVWTGVARNAAPAAFLRSPDRLAACVSRAPSHPTVRVARCVLAGASP
jgi:hypothetical protein